MAKMFYTLEEAAERLGVSEDQLKNMAASGRLQQFRDRDKLMFKRDQVDALAASAGTAADESGSPIPLQDSKADTDAIDLKSDSGAATSLGTAMPDSTAGMPRREDPRQATGISVFDAGEVEPVDPSAKTVVTSPQIEDEELVLDSVGSGSGLLDLTRESDDTSLGAELLDEIYPGGGEASDQKMESAVGSSGVFDGAIAVESGPSGLENLQTSSEVVPTGGVATYAAVAEAYDPAGSGLGIGMLLGATVSLVIVLIIAISAVSSVPSQLTAQMTAKDNTLLLWTVGLLVGSILFGAIGYFVGKSRE
jgi:excisionase family DNA binding protein